MLTKKTMKNIMPVHETFRIGALLAIVGGFLDAYTYILRGGVFANAQTGNIVLLAISLAKGSFKNAGLYLIPILAFALGVFVTEWIKNSFNKVAFIEWEHFIILIEIVLLFVVGFIPPSFPDPIVNVSVSFICSIQVNSFRKIGSLSYASTMCTGNLRSAFENLFKFSSKKDKKALFNFLNYLGIIILFILGAALGTLLSHFFKTLSVWFCGIILALVFLIMILSDKTEENN